MEDTSFYKAMSSSVGVLAILDKDATPFRRIWCVFEECIAMKEEHSYLIFDIATCHLGSPQVLAGTLTPHDNRDWLPGYVKGERERSFPVEIIVKSLDFKVEDAEASREEDRHNILKWMKDFETD